MNYKLFIDQEVINKNNEEGIVVSFDENLLVVKYENETKTYNSKIVLKNSFIRFVNPDLNKIITESVNKDYETENKEKEEIERINQEVIKRNKQLMEEYEALSRKNNVMQALFGKDFNYPPYIEFRKKHRELIRSVDAYYFLDQRYW